ncbi:MAG TPA: DUF6335 family protein [Thermoanaerobaculia bacterium]|nr:DUF6335 family protein [Thermoanaerobaculia bacterium]
MDKTDKLTKWDETEKRDRNANGLDDSIEPPDTDISTGSARLAERANANPGADPTLSAGDVDARWEAAESEGDETVAGSMATPEQNDVQEMGAAMGITYADDEVLKVGEKERSRDQHRWELDPASSEDYQERLKDAGDDEGKT